MRDAVLYASARYATIRFLLLDYGEAATVSVIRGTFIRATSTCKCHIVYLAQSANLTTL